MGPYRTLNKIRHAAKRKESILTEKPRTSEELLNEQLIINETQLILAEKRTYHSMFRTGLTVFTFPLTALGFIAATLKQNNLLNHPWIATAVILGLFTLSIIGFVIFLVAMHKIRRLTRLINFIKSENERIAEILL